MKRGAAALGVRSGEGRAVACAFLWFFCVLASYYVLRPVREAMGIVGNVKDLTRLFLGTLAATLVLTPVLAALVSRLPRRRFVPIVYRFFALNLVVFWLFLRGDGIAPNVARAFFVWTSVFNLFALSVFWGLLADLFRREEGARLFGVIGAGGTLGAIAGSFVTAALVERLGIAALVLVSAGLLELAVRFIGALVRARGDSPANDRQERVPEGGVLRWLPALLRSRQLLAIVGYMLLFSFTSTCVYFEQARIVKAAIATSAARTALFARMDLAANLLALVIQAFAVARVLRRLGVGGTLVLLPLLTLAGFFALGASPTLAVLVVFQVLRRAADYGVAKPAREVLFTVLPRDEKYKAKSFIDTFVYRTGDALGAVVDGLLPGSALGLLAVAVPLGVAWAGTSLYLGRAHRAAAGSRARSASCPSDQT